MQANSVGIDDTGWYPLGGRSDVLGGPPRKFPSGVLCYQSFLGIPYNAPSLSLQLPELRTSRQAHPLLPGVGGGSQWWASPSHTQVLPVTSPSATRPSPIKDRNISAHSCPVAWALILGVGWGGAGQMDQEGSQEFCFPGKPRIKIHVGRGHAVHRKRRHQMR